jgi:hypothetical protein
MHADTVIVGVDNKELARAVGEPSAVDECAWSAPRNTARVLELAGTAAHSAESAAHHSGRERKDCHPVAGVGIRSAGQFGSASYLHGFHFRYQSHTLAKIGRRGTPVVSRVTNCKLSTIIGPRHASRVPEARRVARGYIAACGTNRSAGAAEGRADHMNECIRPLRSLRQLTERRCHARKSIPKLPRAVAAQATAVPEACMKTRHFTDKKVDCTGREFDEARGIADLRSICLMEMSMTGDELPAPEPEPCPPALGPGARSMLFEPAAKEEVPPDC